jgi:hypothetical protein
MNIYREHGDSSSMDIAKEQKVAVAQLIRAITTMRHVDELFQWLAYTIVHRFDVQFTQFWANQANRTDQFAVQLRAMVSQDPSVQQQIAVNDQVASIARRIIKEQFTYHPQPVENIFSHYQAILLKRYGLYYCTNCFISSSGFLPPRGNIFSQDGLPTSLAMTALLFLRQAPQPELGPVVSAVIEQAVAAAENRGLLLPTAYPSQPPMIQAVPQQGSPPPLAVPQQGSSPSLNELIPRRRQESALMLSSNPFAGSAIIADKQARRLYAAIDDHTNVVNLCNALAMDIKQVSMALQILLTQKRIELYEPGGRVVDASLFLNYR